METEYQKIIFPLFIIWFIVYYSLRVYYSQKKLKRVKEIYSGKVNILKRGSTIEVEHLGIEYVTKDCILW